MTKILVGVVALAIVAAGGWYLFGSAPKEKAADYSWRFTEAAESPDAPGVPRSQVDLLVNGRIEHVGEFDGSCFVVEKSQWPLLPGEKSAAICWFAGGGSEIAVYEERGKDVVKIGSVDEGTAEKPGVRGYFETVFEL